jgi:hypothetical protein
MCSPCAGLGLNADELKRNKVLTDYDVVDLNEDPKLPYDDNTYDIITNAVSVEYLTKPLAMFRCAPVMHTGESTLTSMGRKPC